MKAISNLGSHFWAPDTVLWVAATIVSAWGMGCASPADAELASVAPSAISAAASRESCLKAAQAEGDAATSKGANPSEVRLVLEVATASCVQNIADSVTAQFVGTMNRDLAFAGKDYLEGTRSGQSYFSLVIDRRQKLSRFKTDATYRQKYASGDKDGDLVPDSFDACPDSPQMSATDDRGCPDDKNIPPGPSASEDQRMRDQVAQSTMIFSTACDGAPRPSVPQALEWGSVQDPAFDHAVVLAVSLSRSKNQPAGCPVFYEVQFEFQDPRPAEPGVIMAQAHQFGVFGSHTLDNLSPDNSRRIAFALSMRSEHDVLPEWKVNLAKAYMSYGLLRFRARATNGNGLSSSWGAWQRRAPSGNFSMRID